MGWLIPAICVSLIVVAVLCGSVWYAWKHRDKICVSATPSNNKEELLPSSPPAVLESRGGEGKEGGGFPGNQGRRISTVDSSNLDSILQGLQGAEDECELDMIQESEHQESDEAAMLEKEELEQQEEAAMLKKEELEQQEGAAMLKKKELGQQEEADMLDNKYLQYDQGDTIEIEGRVEEQEGDREEENKEDNKEEENGEENEEELMIDPVENGDFSSSEEGEKVDQDDLVTMATDQNKTRSMTTAAEKETDPDSSECISQTVENENVLDERTVLAALADSLRGTEVDSEDDWESEYKSEPSGSESAKNSESAENSDSEKEEFARRAECETYKSEESECGKKLEEEEVKSSDEVESRERGDTCRLE